MLRPPLSLASAAPTRIVTTASPDHARGLKFGRKLRTPAMQAGLAARRLSFREIFTSVAGMFLYVLMVIDYWTPSHRMKDDMAAA